MRGSGDIASEASSTATSAEVASYPLRGMPVDGEDERQRAGPQRRLRRKTAPNSTPLVHDAGTSTTTTTCSPRDAG